MRIEKSMLLVAFVGAIMAWPPVIAAAKEPNLPPAVGEKAADFNLKTPAGDVVKLSDKLKSGNVVLIVLRGFPGYQCPICNTQVGQFVAKAKAFEEAKASIVLVYPGPAEGLVKHADEFITGKTLPKNVTLVIDPDYAFTQAYNLRWDEAQETAYPSTFVIDRDSVVRFAKVSKTHGDRSSPGDVLKAIPAK